MQRITGALGGLALAGSMGVGFATSAQAAPTAATSDVSISAASGDRAACTYRYVNRGTQLRCGTAAAGTQYRAWAKCKRPNGSTYAKRGAWKRQGSGQWSTARCFAGHRLIKTTKVGELR